MNGDGATSPTGPMDALDEQVRNFARTALDRPGVVTGWVLLVGSTRFDDDGDVLHAYDYAVGKDTPMVTAVGLVELGSRRMHRDIASGDNGPDDDEVGG